MFARPPTRAVVPSRAALRVLRQLAWAGSTVGAIGGVCTITYEVHRRVGIAEQLVASKRELQSSCPNYNAGRGAATMAKMMEAAEAGEFYGVESMKKKDKNQEEQWGNYARNEQSPLESDGSRSPKLELNERSVNNPRNHTSENALPRTANVQEDRTQQKQSVGYKDSPRRRQWGRHAAKERDSLRSGRARNPILDSGIFERYAASPSTDNSESGLVRTMNVRSECSRSSHAEEQNLDTAPGTETSQIGIGLPGDGPSEPPRDIVSPQKHTSESALPPPANGQSEYNDSLRAEEQELGGAAGRGQIGVELPASKPPDFRLRYADSEATPTHIRIKRLLSNSKSIAASDLFLDEYSAATPAVARSQRELAVTLFYANLEEDNVFLAKNLFNFLDRYNDVTSPLWEVLLFALSKFGRIGSVADTYSRFADRFELPRRLLAPVLKCLLDSYRLEEAKKLIFKNIQHDKECGLCGIYLHGLWKRTRDVSLMESQFLKLKKSLQYLNMPATHKLYNPLLKAYVEYGMDEQVRALAEEMEECKVSLSVRTLGLLAYGRALSCDWNGVDHYLKQMYQLQADTADATQFAKSFDRIFLEYWLSHTGDEIRDFLLRAINDFGLVPDQVGFEHIVKAVIQKGPPETLTNLLQIAEERSWQVKLNKNYFEELLREHQLSSEFSPAGLWRMFRAAEHKFGYAAASRRILGYDRISFPHTESRKMPWTHEVTTWYRRALSMREPSKPIDQFAHLHNSMLNCLHSGNVRHALYIFRNAKLSGRVVRRLHLELAAVASIIQNGCTSEAKLMLEEENALQFGNPVPPQFFQSILQANNINGVEAYKLGLLAFYNILEQRLSQTKHSLIVPITARLMSRGEVDTGLELFRAVNQSKYGAIKEFESPCMKMLARGFGRTGNLKGIRWVLMTALKRGSARDHNFIVELHRQIGNLRSCAAAEPGQTEQDVDLTVQYFERLATEIEARYQVDMDPKRQRTVRASDIAAYSHQQRRDPSKTFQGQPKTQGSPEDPTNDLGFLEAQLSEWNERAELEKVFTPQDEDAGDLVHWSEGNVVSETPEEDDLYIDE